MGLATHPSRFRRYSIRAITLMLLVSFAFIPVRCDASVAAHSIFASPSGMASMGHGHAAHHASGQKVVPGKSMLGHASHPASPAERQHLATGAFGAEEPGRVLLAGGSDPESQQPVGAALDLPTPPVPPDAGIPLIAADDVVSLAAAAVVVLHGIAISPDAPPPKDA